MKYLVFTDLHLDRAVQRPKRLSSGLKMLKTLLKRAYDEDMTVLFCGDLIDKAVTDNSVVNGLLRVFNGIDMPRLIYISGNHDQSGKNTLANPVSSWADLIDIYFDQHFTQHIPVRLQSNQDYPYSYTYSHDNKDLIVGIDYLEHESDLEKVLEELAMVDLPEAERYILMLHQTPKELGEMFGGDFSISHPALMKFDMVFCGHIHMHKVLSPNFMLVGIPMETNAAEAGLECGYVIYDSEKNTYNHIRTTGMYPTYSSNAETAEEGYFRPEHTPDQNTTSSFAAYALERDPVKLVESYIDESAQSPEVKTLAKNLASKHLQ